MLTMDILELGLKGLGMAVQKKRMDVRMSVSIIIKIIFFGLWFYESGANKYKGGHFATTLVTWVVFHFYILVIEKEYIISGENNIKMRRQSYKIIDIIQTGILIIYFCVQVYVYSIQSTFYNISIISMFVDIGMNFNQMLTFIEKQKAISKGDVIENLREDDEAPNISGGEMTLYCSMVVGAGLAMGVAAIMYIELQKNPDLQTFPFYIWSLYLCWIGEGVFMIFIAFYLVPKVGPPNLNSQENIRNYLSCSPTKHFLCLMYGLCIGLFSLYYAFFLGIYGLFKIIQKVLQIFGWIAQNAQVHPTRN